jgi:YcxB-like protein
MQVSGEMTIGETRSARVLMRRVLLGWKRFSPWIYFGVFAALIVGLIELGPLMPSRLGGSATVLVIYVVGVVGTYWGYFWWTRTSVSDGWRRVGLQKASTIAFSATPDSFTVETSVAKTTVPWAGVYMVAPNRRYWIFMIPGIAYCVPKRFFATPNSETEFLAAVWDGLPPEARARSNQLQARLAA